MCVITCFICIPSAFLITSWSFIDVIVYVHWLHHPGCFIIWELVLPMCKLSVPSFGARVSKYTLYIRVKTMRRGAKYRKNNLCVSKTRDTKSSPLHYVITHLSQVTAATK